MEKPAKISTDSCILCCIKNQISGDMQPKLNKEFNLYGKACKLQQTAVFCVVLSVEICSQNSTRELSEYKKSAWMADL
jgi:hypothetical protein